MLAPGAGPRCGGRPRARRVVARSRWPCALAPVARPAPLTGGPPGRASRPEGAAVGRAKSTRRTGSLPRVYAGARQRRPQRRPPVHSRAPGAPAPVRPPPACPSWSSCCASSCRSPRPCARWSPAPGRAAAGLGLAPGGDPDGDARPSPPGRRRTPPATAAPTCRPGPAPRCAAPAPASSRTPGLLAGRGVVVVVHGALRTTYEPVDASVAVGELVVARAAARAAGARPPRLPRRRLPALGAAARARPTSTRCGWSARRRCGCCRGGGGRRAARAGGRRSGGRPRGRRARREWRGGWRRTVPRRRRGRAAGRWLRADGGPSGAAPAAAPRPRRGRWRRRGCSPSPPPGT